jgi:hypothetical protein
MLWYCHLLRLVRLIASKFWATILARSSCRTWSDLMVLTCEATVLKRVILKNIGTYRVSRLLFALTQVLLPANCYLFSEWIEVVSGEMFCSILLLDVRFGCSGYCLSFFLDFSSRLAPLESGPSLTLRILFMWRRPGGKPGRSSSTVYLLSYCPENFSESFLFFVGMQNCFEFFQCFSDLVVWGFMGPGCASFFGLFFWSSLVVLGQLHPVCVLCFFSLSGTVSTTFFQSVSFFSSSSLAFRFAIVFRHVGWYVWF